MMEPNGLKQAICRIGGNEEHEIYRYVWLVGILLTLTAIFTYVRINSTGRLKVRFLNNGSKGYVVHERSSM